MEKNIRIKTLQIVSVLLLMVGFSLWRFDFVYDAITANIFLNGAIIGTFMFGVVNVFINIYKLGNETKALRSLQEEFSDCQSNQYANEMNDPLWRYSRCKELAVIFKKPEILGDTYQLLSEEMGRTGTLKISADTSQTLLNGVDDKMVEQKSLTSYITGILVLLGLIGTFVGLMVTLASVGSLLATIDFSSGDPLSIVQNLIKGLEVPLGGMATGFSSSLFGLVTSLVLGIIAQFAGLANNALRSGFESWLSALSYIDPESADYHNAGQKGGGANILEARHLQLILRSARFVVANSSRNTKSINDMTYVLDQFAEEARAQRQTIEQLSRIVMNEYSEKTQLAGVLHNMAQAIDKNNALVQTLKMIRGEITKDNKLLTEEVKSLKSVMQENENQLATDIGSLQQQLLEGHRDIGSMVQNVKEATESIPQSLDRYTDQATHSHDQAMQLVSDLHSQLTDMSINGMHERLNSVFPTHEPDEGEDEIPHQSSTVSSEKKVV